jgi:hypothetical protein
VPAAGKNGCSTDNASKALAGKPCTTRMVLRAKAKEAL